MFYKRTQAIRNSLKCLSLSPKVVIDIGVQKDTIFLRKAFPKAHHLLVEAKEEYRKDIQRNYKGMSYELCIGRVPPLPFPPQKTALLKIDVDRNDYRLLPLFSSFSLEALIIEATTQNIGRTIQEAEKLGMRLYDVTNMAYMKYSLWQVDLVFVPSSFPALSKDLSLYQPSYTGY